MKRSAKCKTMNFDANIVRDFCSTQLRHDLSMSGKCEADADKLETVNIDGEEIPKKVDPKDWAAQNLTETMLDSRMMYDKDGNLVQFETEDEFDEALRERAKELQGAVGDYDDALASIKESLKGIDDMVESFAAEHSVEYNRQFDEFIQVGDGDSGNLPEENAKNVIRRFVQTLSPSFPEVRECPLIPKRGELIHLHFPVVALYESISSSNTNLRYVGAGDLYVTNKRFAFVFNSQVRSLPYREIEVFTSGWIPGAGRIRISSSTRARMMEFEVPNVFKASFYFSYYTNPSFEEEFKAAGNLQFDTEKRRQLIDAYYARAEEGLRQKAAEEAARKAASAQVPVSAGSGCGMWLFLLVVIGIIVIFVATNSGR